MIRNCVEDNRQSGDFVIFRVDLSNAFNLVSRQEKNVLPFPLNSCHGSFGAMAITHLFFTLKAGSYDVAQFGVQHGGR